MSSTSDSIQAVEIVAAALEACGQRAVFVGGSTLSFFPLALEPRATDDVDVIVDTSRTEYNELVAALYARGFRPCQHDGAPLCRLEVDPDVHVDILPIDPSVLGFSNRWFRDGLKNASPTVLPSGRTILILDPLHFIATKLEAFASRGSGDYNMSEDLSDVVNLLASLPELPAEISRRTGAVETFVAAQLRGLMASPDFVDAISWYFPGNDVGQRSAQFVRDELKRVFG